MLKQLISLVFLFISLSSNYIYADTSQKILPKIKPEKIIKINERKKESLLPKKKPFFIKKKRFS